MISENLEQFVAENNFGVLMRTFATKPSDVPRRVEMVGQALERLENFELNDQRVFQTTDVLVWKDPAYNSDCGETAPALQEAFPQVNVQEMNGDLFCSLMNTGFSTQLRRGVDYTLSISPEAHSYATPETLEDILIAASQRALIIGVAIDELAESILEGRVANTFAMWHNLSLMGVGGFDLRSSSPLNDGRFANYYRGWSTENGGATVVYPLAGVEEVIPASRIFARVARPCIAPIIPRGEGIKQYTLPTDPDLLARHKAKMQTKYDRQMYMLMTSGFDFSWLRGAVMPEYSRTLRDPIPS